MTKNDKLYINKKLVRRGSFNLKLPLLTNSHYFNVGFCKKTLTQKRIIFFLPVICSVNLQEFFEVIG